MPSPVADRLLNFLRYKNMTINELGVSLGYRSKEKLYRLERDDDAKPGYDTILDIGNSFADLNLEWWLTGKGSMLKSDEKKSLGEEIAGKHDISDTEKISLLARLLDSIAAENSRLREDLDLFRKVLEFEKVKKEKEPYEQ